MNDFIRFNIAIIPQKTVFQEAINISRELSVHGDASFVLDGSQFHPHVTCYSPEFPSKNETVIVGALHSLVSNIKPFEISFEGLVVTKEGGPFGIEVKITNDSEIDKFHRKIIDTLNPLREGHLREKYKNSAYFDKFYDKAPIFRKITEKVGYPRVLDLYKPHISIIRYERKDVAPKVVKNVHWRSKSMQVTKLGMFTMGEHGTCKKLLYEFELTE